MPHSRVSKLSAGRIALGYGLVAILWIAFSDAAVTYLGLHPVVMTIKGGVFVFVTAALLYFTIRRLVQAVRLTSQQRDETAEVYRTVVAASEEGICLLDESGRISFLNGRLAAMLGHPAEELQGKRLQDFIDEPQVVAQPGAPQPETRECRLRKDPGPQPWVLISRHPVLNDAGDVVGLVVTLIDIAERKQAEKALRRSDAYLPALPGAQGNLRQSQLASPARYGIAILSVGVALAAALLLEYLHFREAAVPLLLFAVAISSWYGGTGAAVLAAVLSTIGFYWYFIEPVRTIYIRRSDIPYFIIFAAFATLISWFATIRRRVEARLHEQAALLNLTHDTVFVMDMEGVIRYWNRGAGELYGWLAEKAVGKVVHDLLKTVFSRPLEEIKAELIRTGRWEGELVHTKKGGTQVPVASRWSLQRDRHGAPVAILETNNDITERKRAEEALSRLNRELRAISNCNQVLLRATDEQSLLAEICRIVCEEAGYGAAWVGYAEYDQARSVRPVAWAGIEGGYLANLGITWTHTERGGPTGTAIRSGKTCCISDFATDPQAVPWRDIALQQGFRSAIALPLKDQNSNTFGSLTIYSTRANAITSEEIRLIEELAGDLAFGIVTLRSEDARKRAEEALRESEANLNRAQEIAQIGSWHLDLARNQLTWSDEVFRIFGIPKGTPLTYEAFLDSLYPEDRERVDRAWTAAMQGAPYDVEHRILVGDALKWVRERAEVEFDSHGKALEGTGTVQDITERKRAEEALRRSEAYLADAQRLTHTGAWAGDNAAQPMYWSEEMFRIFGFDPQQGLPTLDQWLERIHPDDVGKLWGGFQRSIEEKADSEFEFRIVLPDGTVKHVRARNHPILNSNGDFAQVVGTIVDITEIKRAEQERERLRQLESDLAHINRVSMMGELTASIAHEVNQPLSGLVSNGGACLRWLACDSPNIEEAREAARRIVRDGKRAGEVIARVRALTKRTPMSTEKLDLNQTIREVVALVRDEAIRNSVIIRTQFAERLRPVCGDRVQLQQVILNLVMNGIEAMTAVRNRPRELIITTRDIETGEVQVTVDDSGIGLDPSAMQKIFDSFYTTKPGGMGMGLSISRSILEAHGGRLWAAAKDGPGTAFHLTLPKCLPNPLQS